MNNFKENSKLMTALLALGAVRLAWACRRLHCPVSKSALVLEVGSGGSPYFRSNVLIDAYEETRERHWAPFIVDRPAIIGTGENLPFKDKVFDFVIASHVLEHSADPKKFIMELQRVGKAGYIETPDAFMERINPYWDHRSEITLRNNKLLIRKKNSWLPDSILVELYEKYAKSLITKSVIPSNPFVFHVRYYWEDEIAFTVINPEADANWTPPNFNKEKKERMPYRAKLGVMGLLIARFLFSQKKRNSQINLTSLMKCIYCESNFINYHGKITCNSCGLQYDKCSGILKPKPK